MCKLSEFSILEGRDEKQPFWWQPKHPTVPMREQPETIFRIQFASPVHAPGTMEPCPDKNPDRDDEVECRTLNEYWDVQFSVPPGVSISTLTVPAARAEAASRWHQRRRKACPIDTPCAVRYCRRVATAQQHERFRAKVSAYVGRINISFISHILVSPEGHFCHCPSTARHVSPRHSAHLQRLHHLGCWAGREPEKLLKIKPKRKGVEIQMEAGAYSSNVRLG